MSDHASPTVQLRVVAERSGVKLARVYELFRLPGAPAPVEFVARMPLYDEDAAVAYVTAGRSNRCSRVI